MAQKKTKVQPKQYESNLGKEGMIKTDIYITSPKTVVSIIAKLDDATNTELRFLVDTFLKEKGY